MGLLFQIQNDVQSIAEVIAEALKVETEIVDKDGTVIGATGRIRGQLLTNRTDTFINQYVNSKCPYFRTGKSRTT
ncbi:MAG: hypothetical protein RJR35_05715 [Thermoanaerobacterales bacterium]|nr:hypothetical protein [Thermoanaerobacterales bacterium]